MKRLLGAFALGGALLVSTRPAEAQTVTVHPCGDRAELPRLLQSYDQLVAGQRFVLRLRFDRASNSWQPHPRLRMPMHHASTLEYEGFAMPPAGDYTLELDIEALSRTLRGPEHGNWFATYRVRVTLACRHG